MRRIVQVLTLIAALVASGIAARADDGAGCEKFAWSVARERQAFAAAAKPEVESGSRRTTAAGEGFALKLEPFASAKLAMAPERKPRHGGEYAGMVVIDGLAAKTYQVTLSAEAWIDVIQDGKFVRSSAHSSSRDCAGARKSVRFQLKQAPVTIQVSDVAAAKIDVAIMPAESSE